MFQTIVPLFPGIPGGPELLVILLIAVLLFGANKIPQLARSSGEALGEFKKGREEVEQELEEMREGKEAGQAEADETRTRDAEPESS
jgi:sec-independent protein translocase protein TatA